MLPKLSITLLIAAFLLPALALRFPREDAEAASDASLQSQPRPSEGSIVVDHAGTELYYIDSGAPRSHTYTTIFAVHGLTFTGEVFRNIMDLASNADLRIVSVNRRGYPGSSGYTSSEFNIMANGSDSQKTDLLNDHGLELLTFIDKFIVANDLPSYGYGQSGGIAVMGWSLGNSLTLAAIANADRLSGDARSRLASRLRAVIMQEPPSVALGVDYPPQTWSPMTDTSIPAETQVPMFIQWITSYFKHGDITKGDPNEVSFVVPDVNKTPSIWRMSKSEISKVVYEEGFTNGDNLFLFMLGKQFLANYRKACFDPGLRSLLKQMDVWMVTGDSTASFSIASMWSIQADDRSRGGNYVKTKILPGGNHFVFWDEPSNYIKYLQSML